MYLTNEHTIWVGAGEQNTYLLPSMANRHGLIAGASGTGKTVTLKVLAEGFSDMGVPVFLADIKGDVSGLCIPGVSMPNVEERVQRFHIPNFFFKSYPVRFFDVYGKKGIPVRATISDLGPELLSRIMQLNDTQSSVLQIIFKIADDKQLLLIDTKDLKAMLAHVSESKEQYQTEYGNIAAQTIGAIQRSVVTLEAAGGDIFFGEPALDLQDWITLDDNGHGIINLLNCVELVRSPLLYSTFLLWMLSELYEMLPEAGDLAKPKMVFFFDEAHLLFTDVPKALLQKIEQVVRLIRSKGVGVYFITQSPGDIPDTILAQLGNKIQHALRAYTPKEQKAVKVAAQSFRPNPSFDCETALGELRIGEALVSLLDETGAPCMVQRSFILPLQSNFGVADAELVRTRIQSNYLNAKYAKAIDQKSAFEVLEKLAGEATAIALQQASELQAAKQREKEQKEAMKLAEKEAKERERLEEKRRKEQEKQIKAVTGVVTKMVNSTASSIGREVGRNIMRGLFGTRKR